MSGAVSNRHLPRALASLVMIVQVNVAYDTAECVSVDAKTLCSFGLVAIIPGQRILDKPALKFSDGIFEVDPMLNHLVNQGVKLVLHSRTPTEGFRGNGFCLYRRTSSASEVSPPEFLKLLIKTIPEAAGHQVRHRARPRGNIRRQSRFLDSLRLDCKGHHDHQEN